MTIMVEFEDDGIFYPINSNIEKHTEAKTLAERLGKQSYKFVYLNLEGISKEFLLD